MVRWGLICLLGVLAAVAIGAAAMAQDDQPVLLQYKFTPGQTASYEMTGNGTIPMSIKMGADPGGQAMAMDINLDLRMVMTQTCEKITEEGLAAILTRFPEMLVKTAMAVGEQNVDTVITWEKGALQAQVNGQAMPADDNMKQLELLLGTGIKTLMKPNGATKMDPETAKLLQSLSSVGMGGMQSGMNGLIGAFPDHPVKPGDGWAVELKPEDSGGMLAGTAEYKLEGYEDLDGARCAKITGQARFKNVQPMGGAGAMGASATVTAMDMTVDFTNYFDPALGDLAKMKMTLGQNAEMMITVGGQGGAQAMQIPAAIENSQIQMEMTRVKPAAEPPGQ